MFLTTDSCSELEIVGYKNLYCEEYGLDSLLHSRDTKYFINYPYTINYQFNELGYRERSIIQYTKNPIIVIGDSFTLGMGLPVELRYSTLLENKLNYQVLNFSLNGGSNDWIFRKLNILLKYFDPLALIIHYTYTHRRESSNSSWYDNERTLSDSIDKDLNYENWISNHEGIKKIKGNIPATFLHVPNWHPNKIIHEDLLNEIKIVDYARDKFHYGARTMSTLVDCILDNLSIKP